jgi:Predicted GTPase
LNNIEADAVVLATPAKIEKLIKINKPITRASWELTIIEGPSVKELADEFLSRKGSKTI